MEISKIQYFSSLKKIVHNYPFTEVIAKWCGYLYDGNHQHKKCRKCGKPSYPINTNCTITDLWVVPFLCQSCRRRVKSPKTILANAGRPKEDSVNINKLPF